MAASLLTFSAKNRPQNTKKSTFKFILQHKVSFGRQHKTGDFNFALSRFPNLTYVNQCLSSLSQTSAFLWRKMCTSSYFPEEGRILANENPIPKTDIRWIYLTKNGDKTLERIKIKIALLHYETHKRMSE